MPRGELTSRVGAFKVLPAGAAPGLGLPARRRLPGSVGGGCLDGLQEQ